MTSIDHMQHLRSELDAFQACLEGDLSARVEHCGEWTLHDLADHLGRGNLWAAAAVTDKRGDYQAPPAPHDAADLLTWFADTCAVLLTALHTDPAAAAWTFYPPHTVGFWQRRRHLETLVHRWDAEHALGIASLLDPILCGDGIAEVIEVMAPRQVVRGRAQPPTHAVRFTAAGTASSWVLGPGAPFATLTAPATDLFLMLWGRLPQDHPTITWDGDRRTAQQVLAGPLVP